MVTTPLNFDSSFLDKLMKIKFTFKEFEKQIVGKQVKAHQIANVYISYCLCSSYIEGLDMDTITKTLIALRDYIRKEKAMDDTIIIKEISIDGGDIGKDSTTLILMTTLKHEF